MARSLDLDGGSTACYDSHRSDPSFSTAGSTFTSFDCRLGEGQFTADSKEFDYLLGDWEFASEDKEHGKLRGFWSAVKLAEGQILDEHRVAGDDGETYYVTTWVKNHLQVEVRRIGPPRTMAPLAPARKKSAAIANGK